MKGDIILRPDTDNKFEMTIDHRAEACYIKLHDDEVYRTDDVSSELMFDYNEEGNIIGIEILRDAELYDITIRDKTEYNKDGYLINNDIINQRVAEKIMKQLKIKENHSYKISPFNYKGTNGIGLSLGKSLDFTLTQNNTTTYLSNVTLITFFFSKSTFIGFRTESSKLGKGYCIIECPDDFELELCENELPDSFEEMFYKINNEL